MARRLAVVAIALAVTVAGCSSGGGSPTPAPTRSSVPSAPATVATSSSAPLPTDSEPSAVLSPVPGPPDPVQRTITRPADASVVSGVTCIGVTAVGGVLGAIEGSIFGVTTYDEQLSGLDGAYGSAQVALPETQKAYRAFVRAGYPRSFALVQELATMIMWLKRLYTARKQEDLTAVPAIYVGLRTASAQFSVDAQPSVCSN